KELTLSATYDPSQSLNGDFSLGRFYSSSNVNNPDFYDTLSYIGDSTGNIISAPTLTIGGKYTMRRLSRETDNKRLNSEVSLHATYSSTKWEDFSVPFDTSLTNYLNTTKYTFGIEYTPEIYFIRNRATAKFYERMRYRIGAYYQSLPYETNNEQITDFGTTFGIGIPIAIQKSVSSLNFGFSIGQRGISDSQAFKERYYGINVGITIAPGGDKWFVKRKLN
ncbi:MAG: hypothetical protein MK066_02985, partial [Crocinitomicaceae bacterium]|nr:hypothetical protein [Crocinitomicaceae bacterium]